MAHAFLLMLVWCENSNFYVFSVESLIPFPKQHEYFIAYFKCGEHVDAYMCVIYRCFGGLKWLYVGLFFDRRHLSYIVVIILLLSVRLYWIYKFILFSHQGSSVRAGRPGLYP
jgi:hypothetical protein